jgi:putative sigma-54 modulation protein
MLYNIKGTNLQVTGAKRSYVEKRLRSLDKYFGRKAEARADIELHYKKDEEKMFRAEGTIHDHGLEGDFRAEAIGETLHEAIDVMIRELNLELSRAKKRLIHDKRKGAARFKDFIRGFTDRI